MKYLSFLFLLSGAVFAEKQDDFTAVSSTKFDFGEAQIDGKMQAPAGFFLQGKQAQSLSQMVLLRPHFRNEMKNSKSEVKALIK